ncbi:unnamed protein product, partial [Adineta steineri]
MKTLTLLILLIHGASSLGLSCISDDRNALTNTTFDDFYLEDFIKTLKTLPTDKYGDEELCRLEVFIDYTERYLYINFIEELEDNNLRDQEIQFDTVVQFHADNDMNFRVIGYLLYACEVDGCEIKFLETGLQTLINADYTDLGTEIVPIILEDDEKNHGTCFNSDDNDTHYGCDYCEVFMLFDEEKKEITSNQDCDDFSEDVHSEVSFLIILRPSTDYIGYRLYARCRYDDCNGENNLVKLKQIFHTKYDFALMHEMLEYETESKESEEKTMASPALTTTESKITSGSSSTSMTSPYTQNTQTST